MIRVDQIVPVDAKFPLDNFERLVTAGDDAEQVLHEKAFDRDVKQHVDAIASKYILPAENTYDFAFMYLPAESVYYELVCGTRERLRLRAGQARVPRLADDPARLSAGDRARPEGHSDRAARAGGDGLLRPAGQDFGASGTDFEVVGTHLRNAQTKYGEADRRLDRFGNRLEQAADWQEAVEPAAETHELPRAVDAA